MLRREFFRQFIVTLIAIPFVKALAADDAAKESDPMAKALNYCENADKGKGKVCPNRKDPTKKDQYCDSPCQFYTPEGKDKGKCQLLQNKIVKAKGWCNSFVKKAG